MPSSIRTITLIVAYWLVFLSFPLLEGRDELTRALFVFVTLLRPEENLLGTWFGDGRLPMGILDRLPIAIGTFVWLGLAGLIGWPWCCRLSFSTPNAPGYRIVRISLACLAGLAILSTMTLLVGLAGGLKQNWILALSALVLAVLSQIISWQARRLGPVVDAPDAQQASSIPQTIMERGLDNLAIAATLWLAVVTMFGAWVPPNEFDVVEYHLQAPKEFFQAGRIEFVPHNIYANMPLGAEMHSLAMMTSLQEPDAWLGGLIGKSITAAISLLGAAFLGGWMAQRMGRFAGWMAAGVWLGSPGITHVAAHGLIDGVLATYVLVTAIATWEAWSACEHKLSTWTLAFLMAGATAALKYPGLIYATLPCLICAGFELVRFIRASDASRARQLCALALLGMALTCAPWYAKSWWLAGNPVYPLAAGVFGGRTLTTDKISQWQSAHRVPAAAPADADIGKQLAGRARQLGNDVARVMIVSPFVQPTMIFGVVCAFAWLLRIRRSQSSPKSERNSFDRVGWFLLAWSAWIMCVWWLATHRIDRFWLPVTGLWSALAAGGIWQIRQRSYGTAQIMLLSGLLYAALLCSSPAFVDNRYFVSLAGLRDDIGDEQHAPRVPPVQAWINQHLSATEDRVLLVGEARVFEYRVPVVYSTCFDTNPGQAWLADNNADNNADQQRAQLKAAGITHVLINWIEIQRYRSPGNYGFSQWPQPSHLEQLVRDQVLEPINWGPGSDSVVLLRVK